MGLLCKKIPRAGEVLVGPYDEYRVTFMFSSTWYIVGMSKGGIYITVLNLFGTNGLVETLLIKLSSVYLLLRLYMKETIYQSSTSDSYIW